MSTGSSGQIWLTDENGDVGWVDPDALESPRYNRLKKKGYKNGSIPSLGNRSRWKSWLGTSFKSFRILDNGRYATSNNF